MAEKRRNFSLFFYTGLIFVVAVLLIIIAFFSQSKVEQSQPDQINAQTEGITQRAAILSEENKTLLEENMSLKKAQEENTRAIDELNGRVSFLEENVRISEAIISANGYVSKKMYSEARNILKQINEENLSDDEKILYNSLMKKVGKD
jgi:outer membrane PBP1 activator LpoA protein